MNILIVEGMATSGKSSLIDSICQLLGRQRVKVFSEDKTHEPIMNKTDELLIDFFKLLLRDAVQADTDLVIFDRLHYTQAYRAKASVAEYFEIEALLAKHDTLVAYLQVDEGAIAERVRLAAEHRDEEWGNYVQTKGKTFDVIAEYYIAQQRGQFEIMNRSKLPTRVFNTTQHNYRAIAEQIIDDWFKKHTAVHLL